MFADDLVTLNAGGVAVVGTLLATIAGTVVFLHKALMKAKDDQLEEAKQDRDSAMKMAQRAADNLQAIADKHVIAAGGVPLPVVAAVLPEKNSPTTERQRVAAEFQTLNASIVASELALGIVHVPKAVQ